MKRTFYILTLIFTIQFCLSQEATQQSYNLYGKSLKDTIIIHTEHTISDTSNGILSIEHLDQKIDGELTTFSVQYSNNTHFHKNKLEKTFLKDRTNFIATIMGQTLHSVDSSSLEGKTVLFHLDKNKHWTIPELASYEAHEQVDLEEELRALNDSLKTATTHFTYPKTMRIGEKFTLSSEHIFAFYEIKDIKEAKGTMVLKEVATRENDTVAIFDIDIEIRGLIDPTDKAYMSIEMSGTVERSLTHFYDREINLLGNIKMDGYLSKDQYMTMVVPANLVMKQRIKL